MIRTLNFAFIAITCLVCLGVYRTAEQARVEQRTLKATQVAIVRENDMLTVLGAEWARITQPARIQALTQRHLDLSDLPDGGALIAFPASAEESLRSRLKAKSATPKRWCRSRRRTPDRSAAAPQIQPARLPDATLRRSALEPEPWRSAPAAPSLVRNRIAFAALFSAVCFSIIVARLIDVMVFGATSRGTVATLVHPMRADLVDRNGVLIARDLPVSDLYATPSAFWDTDEAAQACRGHGRGEARI